MPSVISTAIGAGVAVIGVLVFVTIYAAINKDNISTEAQALLVLIPIALAVTILIGAFGGLAGG